MKKHIIFWAIAVGILGGIILTTIVVTTPVRRFPVGVLAVSPDEAILITRFEDVAISRHFVERVVRGDEGGAWSVEMSPMQPAEGFDATSLAVAGDVVVGQGTDGQRHDFAFALGRADGALRWQIQLPGVGGADLGGRLEATTLVDGERVYLVHDVEVVTAEGVRVVDRLDVVLAANGASLWSASGSELGRDRVDVILYRGDLVVSGTGARARRFDPASGARRDDFGFETLLCSTATAMIGADGQTLVIASGAGPERRIDLGADADLGWTKTCGFRGGAVIVDVKRSFVPHLVKVELASGALVWDRVLGAGTVLDGPLAVGDFPRLVPVSLCGQAAADGPNVCQLVVVDVDAGQVVQRHRPPRAESVKPVTTPERAYVWVRHAGLWVALDATTGALGDTWRLSRFFDLEPQVDDIADGMIWLAPRLVAHPGALPWAVLELEANRIVAHGGDVDIEAVSPGLDAALP